MLDQRGPGTPALSLHAAGRAGRGCDTAGGVRWVSGAPGCPPVHAGTEIVIVRGCIAKLYMFFDPLPA